MAPLLYAQTLEMDITVFILPQNLNTSGEVLRQGCTKSSSAVNRTNGQLQTTQELHELENEDYAARLAKAMQEMPCVHPEAEQMIWDLSRQLGQINGKKTCGYLPKPMEKPVDKAAAQIDDLCSGQSCAGGHVPCASRHA